MRRGSPCGADESQPHLLLGGVEQLGAPMKRRSCFVVPPEAIQRLAKRVEGVGALGGIVEAIQCPLELVQRHRLACGRLSESEINAQPRGQTHRDRQGPRPAQIP